MKCQDEAAKTDLQTVVDEHLGGVRGSIDGEIPYKPVKKPSIFKVLISGQSDPAATSAERKDVSLFLLIYYK